MTIEPLRSSRQVQEWTYRVLGAALAHHFDDAPAAELAAALPVAGPVPAPDPVAPDHGAPTTAVVREWARLHGIAVPDRGRLRPEVRAAYRDRERTGPSVWSE